MHDYITSFTVGGLFGRLAHHISLRVDDRVTILTGVNGSGKTHVLNLLKATADLDFESLSRMPYVTASVEYQSGRRLNVQRTTNGTSVHLHVEGYLPERTSPFKVNVTVRPDMNIADVLPNWRRIGEDLWEDQSDGEILMTEELRNRYGNRLPIQGTVTEYEEDDSEWLSLFRPSQKATLIETARLDVSRPPSGSRHPGVLGNRRQTSSSRVGQYVERVQQLINEARRQSLAISQRADRDFAARALDRAREKVKTAALRQRYKDLAGLNQALHSNGLTEETIGFELPAQRLNETELRIMNVFLDDWETKMQPLVPVHAKLEILRRIVGGKLRGKTMSVSTGELIFFGPDGETLAVDRLSSGEQHLIALFSMLLFYADPGVLVLIDEPELSLHAAWKHAFLDDIRKVALESDLQIVMATHSTAIINGEWHLEEELSIGDPI